jgi:hypothetical protein
MTSFLLMRSISELRLDSCHPGGSETSALDDTIHSCKCRSAGAGALQKGECASGGDITNARLGSRRKRSSEDTSRSEAQSSKQRCSQESRRHNHPQSDNTDGSAGGHARILRCPLASLLE